MNGSVAHFCILTYFWNQLKKRYLKACYFIHVLRKLTDFEVRELFIPIKHRQQVKVDCSLRILILLIYIYTSMIDSLTALFSILKEKFKTKLVFLLEHLQTLRKQCNNICFLVFFPLRPGYYSYTLRFHFNKITINIHVLSFTSSTVT